MTWREQDEHKRLCQTVRAIISALRLTRCQDEDVAVARARLENWLTENDERWVR